jgi:hypothetical protein
METTLLLADYARVADGKLDLMGAGWCATGPGPATFGVGMLFHIGWNDANVSHHFTLDLLDADGDAVVDPEAHQPVLHFEADFEAGRPAGAKAGGILQTGAVALNAIGLKLPPESSFQLRLVVDGDEDAAATVPFVTRPDVPQIRAA